MKYKISFVIPIYNSQKYLRECVDSIIAQDCFDETIQIVLSDDGSTDASAAICDMYSQRFENIKTLHLKNAGVSAARNSGMKEADGEYIMFSDSDDFWFNGTLKKVLEVLKTNSPDMIFYNFKYEQQDFCRDIIWPFKENTLLDRKYITETIADYMISDTEFNSVWNKAFKKSVIEENNILFEDGKIYGEDRDFILNFFAYCNSAWYIPYVGYFYRYVKSGAIQKSRSNYFDIICESFLNTEKAYEKIGFDKENFLKKKHDRDAVETVASIFLGYKNCDKSTFVKAMNSLYNNEVLMKSLKDFYLSGEMEDPAMQKVSSLALKKKTSSIIRYLKFVDVKTQIYKLLFGQAAVPQKEDIHFDFGENERLKWPVKFTVFTPIYNRRKTVHRVFDSLMAQTYKNFEWLIVDDGSTDNVKELIDEYKKEADFNIRYYYKKNGGKHTAINYACLLTDSEYFLIIDSDDAIPPDAIEVFNKSWDSIPKEKQSLYWSVVGLCRDSKTGELIGDRFPDGINEAEKPRELAKNVKGEKSSCMRTAVLKKFPFPEPEGTYFITESIVWNKIDKVYRQYYINDIVRIYYQNEPDSLMNSWYKNHVKEGYVSNYFWMVSNLNDAVITGRERLVSIFRASYYGRVSGKKNKEILKSLSHRGDRAVAVLTFPITPLVKKLRNNKYFEQEE